MDLSFIHNNMDNIKEQRIVEFWVKESCYNENEHDYYGVFLDLYELEYFGVGNNIILFKCHLFDTERCIRVHTHHGLVEVNNKSRLASNEYFVLVEHTLQVYYSWYPCTRLNQQNWQAIYKVKARNKYDGVSNINLVKEGDNEYVHQEDQTIPRSTTPLNELYVEYILDGGDMEQVDMIQDQVNIQIEEEEGPEVGEEDEEVNDEDDDTKENEKEEIEFMSSFE